jgi:hypothetical protein
MGEAKRRGTPEQRQAEGKAKAQALAGQKALQQARAEQRRREEWAALPEKQKQARLLIAGMVGMAASTLKGLT